MHLYLRESPRTLLLVTSSEEERRGCPRKALVFRVAEGSTTQVVVEFLPKEEVSLSGVTKLTSRPVIGCLGLINVQNDVFLVVVTSALEIGNLIPSSSHSYSVSRILETAFFSLTVSTFDELPPAGDALPSPVGYSRDDNSGDRDRDYISSGSAAAGSIYEHPCAALTKIFASGTFYYAPDPHWDISTRLAERIKRDRSAGHDVGVFDPRFVWNENLVGGLLEFRERLDVTERVEFDRCKFLLLVIQGYVGVFTVPLPTREQGVPNVATLALISRLGWKRAGTRFNTRGVDDDGNVANFVETETLCSTEHTCFSYTQVRGSVPLFWEQTGLQTFVQRIQITRSQAAAAPAFERHFAGLLDEYNAVHIINLLGSKENEVVLSQAYSQLAARGIGGENIGMTNFDFHNAVKVGGHDSVPTQLKRYGGVVDGIDSFGFTIVDLKSDQNDIVMEQRGVFRTNCLDCLDRTNFVQDIVSKSVLEQYFLQTRPEWASAHSVWAYHRELWAESGDALSRIYAGTGALNTSYTRSGKRTLAGVLSDATKSVSRAYINNFQDRSKQTAIDLLLGNLSNNKSVTIFNPIHDSVRAALASRLGEYSSTYHVTMFAGTWNLNGRPPSESLLPWLFPRPDSSPDVFVLGFQEMVPLTAQQIVQTDPDKRRMWERILTDTFDKRPDKKADYVLLRSAQLVGTALILFVKSSLTSVIRNVEATTRKTGLSGMAGNKGGVAIRFDYEDSSYCFITAHLAAGHTQVEERNSDYRTIVNGMHFLKGKTVGSHENVIWLADTNYRIDLENEVVRQLAVTGEFDQLVGADQLKRAMDQQQVFIGYEEGPLLFAPTYRYDLHSTEYDTSEKMRIPAWTDRILYRGRSLDLSAYSRVELFGSDHRPVFAIFRAEVRKVDAQKKAALRKQLLQAVTSKGPGENLEQHLQRLVPDSDLPDSDLPPPSTDDLMWWDTPDHPKGVANAGTFSGDSDVSDESPSSSDEELYSQSHALNNLPPPLTPQRKPPPPQPNGGRLPFANVPRSSMSTESI
ncbi:inositol polyphosphate phosphatase [Exidia glandulosa HHB12029]|uniref:phosphoinositide 5-phosphatase n=1 Tax=Exidia glandulosa HHB12029 TaxID=1314781 RepID=A0A165QZ37_EXIGL|nr:inositol polyphosphate phosphatase [Exidia glandulosa HHB12029]